MNIDDIKDQTKEAFQNARRQIEENPAYVIGKEKYDVLDPKVQKIIIISITILALLLIMMLPMSFMNSSTEQLSSFEESRGLIKEMLRVDRQLKSGPKAPRPLSIDQLKNTVTTLINGSALLPEQIESIAITTPRVSRDVICIITRMI